MTIRIWWTSAIIILLAMSACKDSGQDVAKGGEPNYNPYILKGGKKVELQREIVNLDSVQKPKFVPTKGRFIQAGKPSYTPLSFGYKDIGKPRRIQAEVKEINIDFSEMDTVHANGKYVPFEWPEKIPATPTKRYDSHLPLSYLDVEQGLSGSRVHDILEDNRGWIWISSLDGLSVWDGKNVFDFGQSLNAQVRPLEMDSKGNIWIGTTEGLFVWDGIGFIHYSKENGLGNNYITSIVEDEHGTIWLAHGLGLSAFQPHQNAQSGIFFHPLSLTPKTYEKSLMKDRKGDMWMFTNDTLHTWTPTKDPYPLTIKQVELPVKLTPPIFLSMIEDFDGNIWVGTSKGIYVFDGTDWAHYSRESGLKSEIIRSLLFDKTGKIWIGSEVGLSILEIGKQGQAERIIHYSAQEGLSENQVISLMEGAEGTIWIGTLSGGLNILNPKGFYHYSTRDGLNMNAISCLYKDTKGRIWMGTNRGGINIWDGKGFLSYTVQEGFTEKGVFCILEDRQENIWLGTWDGGLFRWNPEKKGKKEGFTYYTTKEGLGGNKAVSLFEDQAGRIWIGTFRNGLNIWEAKNGVGKEGFTRMSTGEGLDNNSGRTILQDQSGRIWTTSFDEISLIENYPDNPKITHFSSEKDLINWNRNSLLIGEKGNMWMSASHGLNLWDVSNSSSSITMYTMDEGLSDHGFQNLFQDKKGNLWAGGSIGLQKLSNSEGKQETLLTFFDHQDGFRGPATDMLVDQNNVLWISGNKGLNTLDLNKQQDDATQPKLFIQNLGLFRENLDWRNLKDSLLLGSKPSLKTEIFSHADLSFDSVKAFTNLPLNLSLPHDVNSLRIDWSATHWYAPHKLKYSYLLEGDGRSWSYLITEDFATFQNLSRGNYTFKVRALGGNGKWSETASFAFTIRPPWWQTWLAYLSYGILGAALVWAIVRLQTYSLRIRVLERTKEIRVQQQRSDELLLNILPSKVAHELKATGKTEPVFFEEVSILFADFKGFTNIVASIPGKKLVTELHDIFQAYDDIMEDLGLEKIQTVGDAYLAAGGIPIPDSDHAKKCVMAAQRIIAFLQERNQREAIKWHVRIGIHSGPITAGVIGKKKFSYDLFGDTINIAARIESASESNRINVSAYTADLIKDDFRCTYRGKIDAKGKGELDMYFVDS